MSKSYNRLSEMLPAMKGMAIFMVVIYHLWGFTKGYSTPSEIVISSLENGLKGLIEASLNLFCLLGEQGVHIFLVASGFGLAASWWRRENAAGSEAPGFSVLSFWRRRLMRIFPLYWIAIGWALLLWFINPELVPFGQEIWSQGTVEAIAAIIASLTTLRNVLLKYYYFLNGAWWYVGLAIQLYLVFPFLYRAGKRWGWSLLLEAAFFISLVYRGIVIALDFDGTELLLRGTLFPPRLFEFVFGMVLAVALLEHGNLHRTSNCSKFFLWSKALLTKPRWLGVNLIIWSLGIACQWASSESWIARVFPADALLGVGEVCLMFRLLILVPWFNHWLSILGKYSYGIYLTHMNMQTLLWIAGVNMISYYWLRFGLVAVLSCVLGILFELGANWVLKIRVITNV